MALAATYSARRPVARQALTGWLEARGVQSDAEVEAVGPSLFRGRIRVGPPSDPDFAADQVEVRYALKGFWADGPLRWEIQSVRLTRPVLKARWRDGRLTFGSLDPLIAEFRRRPPRPDARQPLILVENGLVRLDSPYGPVRLRAGARLVDGKLLRLDLRTERVRLRGPGLDARLGAGALRLATRADRVDLNLTLPIEHLEAGGARLEAGAARLVGQGPYPDLRRRRGDGAVRLRLTAEARALGLGGAALGEGRLKADFDGRSAGWIDTLSLAGAGQADLKAGSAVVGAARAGPLSLRAETGDLTWTRRGEDVVRAGVTLASSLDSMDAGGLNLTRMTARLAGPVSADSSGAKALLAGAVSGQGRFTGLGAPLAEDAPQIAALKRGARDFSLDAPRLSLAASPAGVSLSALAPIRLRPRSGGQLVLAAVAEAPLFERGGGQIRLAMEGGGLPQGQAQARYRLIPAGLSAVGALSLRTGFANARDGTVDAAGELRVAKEGARFLGSRCARLTAARLELGVNDVEALAGELCPSGAPLFTLAGRRWRVQGRAQDVQARVPLLQTGLSQGAGRVDAAGGPAGIEAAADITGVRLADMAPTLRFNPLRASGRATLRAQTWRAALVVSDPAGRRLGQADLRHAVDKGEGGMAFETGPIVFAEGGLQPAALSPLVGALGPPVQGNGRFSGTVSWTPQGAASRGELEVSRLDFQSPAGPVTGLAGRIAFSSLAPLTAADGQALSIEQIAAVAPLTGARVTFGLVEGAARIAAGEARVGGGRVRLEPFSLPLTPRAVWNTVLIVEEVQLSDLVEASPFADQVDLTAKVTGRMPFRVSPDGVHVTEGELHAVEPGRLSIRRQALDGVAASAAPEPAASPPAAAPNAFTDFAYQALENLAFDRLSAEINSLPQGRLGVLFRIKGEHSPPQRQEIRVGAGQLLDRSFLDRPLPLPSGVKVDLTLDTSLNLDQLLGDWAGYQQLRRSDGVQR